MKHIVLFIGSVLLTTACGGRIDNGLDGDYQLTSATGSTTDSGDESKTVINMTIDTEEETDPASNCIPGSQPGCTVYYSDGSVMSGYVVCQSDRRWGSCTSFDQKDAAKSPDDLKDAGFALDATVGSIGIPEENVGGCPAGQKTCHDCRALDIKYPVTLPWGENLALAGYAENLGFVFIQNDGGEWNPAVLRSYGFAGTLVNGPTTLPTSNWQASIFSSSTGFVVTTLEHSQNPGALIQLDQSGAIVKQSSTSFSSGSEGQNGLNLLISSSVNATSTEVTHGVQLMNANGDLAKRVPVSTVKYNEDGEYVSYPYVNRPSMVDDTVAVPNGIMYFEGALKGKTRSRFDIAKIDGSQIVSAEIDETASLNASWSIGNSYFLWSTRADEGESIYRIQKNGAVTSRFALDESPSLVVKRPSGFATLVRENLSLYRYTWGGKLLSANMLIPGAVRDDSEIALTSSDDSHFLVAVSNKTQNTTNLYFVVCE